jgi:hypothetical protein
VGIYVVRKHRICTEKIPADLQIQLAQYIGTYVLGPTLSLSIYPRFEDGEAELIPYCK